MRVSQHPASGICKDVQVPGALEHTIRGILSGKVTKVELCSEGPCWALQWRPGVTITALSSKLWVPGGALGKGDHCL